MGKLYPLLSSDSKNDDDDNDKARVSAEESNDKYDINNIQLDDDVVFFEENIDYITKLTSNV